MNSNEMSKQTPSAPEFRVWLKASIVALGLRPTVLARSVGHSVNSVSNFLRDPAREITLGSAERLERHLRQEARAKGVDLGDIQAGGA